MAESKTSWLLKTMGLVILAAVVTALLTTWLQILIWGKTNGGVSGGAAAGVAVAIFMANRHRLPQSDKTP
jgi:hypothetical protein